MPTTSIISVGRRPFIPPLEEDEDETDRHLKWRGYRTNGWMDIWMLCASWLCNSRDRWSMCSTDLGTSLPTPLSHAVYYLLSAKSSLLFEQGK